MEPLLGTGLGNEAAEVQRCLRAGPPGEPAGAARADADGDAPDGRRSGPRSGCGTADPALLGSRLTRVCSVSSSGSADLVIVANRLPVDRVTNDDGSPGWRRSPGGLVTALEPVMRANDGAWIGWPGGTEQDLEPFEDDGLSLVPMTMSRRGDRGVLRGLLQRHPVAAVPRPRGQARVPPRVVGLLRRGQPAVRRRRPPRSPPRARRSGCTTTSSSWCRRCCASCAPTCGSASTCTSRSRRPSCSSSCRGAARSSRACSAPTWSASSCPAGRRTSCAWSASGSATRPIATSSTCPTAATVRAKAFPISIDTAGFEELARSEAVAERADEIREALGQPAQDLPGHRPARLHQGHLRAAARVQRADRRRPPRRRGRGVRPGRDAVAGAGRAVPHPARRHRPPGRPHQRRPRPDRPAGDLLPALLATPARRWRRSTAPPTSWW